jgi:hypothetical protein
MARLGNVPQDLILRSDPKDRVSKDGGTRMSTRPCFETPASGRLLSMRIA